MDVPLVCGVLPEASRVAVTHEQDSSATCPVSQTVLLPQWPVGACMLDFHSRRHLLDHLAHVSPPCLMAMVFDSNGEVPAHLEDPDFEEVFPQGAPVRKSQRRAVRVPTVRAAGPRTQAASSTSMPFRLVKSLSREFEN